MTFGKMALRKMTIQQLQLLLVEQQNQAFVKGTAIFAVTRAFARHLHLGYCPSFEFMSV